MWLRRKISEYLVNDNSCTTMLACIEQKTGKGYIGAKGDFALLEKLFLQTMEREPRLVDFVLKIAEEYKTKNSQY